jgi:N-acetylmuramoyl-L-alanine amidase
MPGRKVFQNKAVVGAGSALAATSLFLTGCNDAPETQTVCKELDAYKPVANDAKLHIPYRQRIDGESYADRAEDNAYIQEHGFGDTGLGMGASGKQVKYIQTELERVGFAPDSVGAPTSVTPLKKGDYCVQTAVAVATFQKAEGMPVTGRVDANTWNALYSKGFKANDASATNPPQSLGELSTFVLETEELLHQNDFNAGTIDGLFDSQTLNAVKAFEAKAGRPVDGKIDAKDLAALIKGFDQELSKNERLAKQFRAMKKKVHFIQRPSRNHSSRNGKDVEFFLWHYTATTNLSSALNTLRFGPVSAHWLVAKDGDVYVLVDTDRSAWHAGDSKWEGRFLDMNRESVGVEVLHSGKQNLDFTPAQYRSLIVIGVMMLQEYPELRELNKHGHLDNFIGHRESAWERGRKSDPPRAFRQNRTEDQILAFFRALRAVNNS